MLHKPKLKGFLTVFPLSDTTWGVRGGSDELWRLTFGDPEAFTTFSRVLPYLTGTHTVEEIARALATDRIDEAAVTQLLDRMQENSLLEDAEGSALSPAETDTFRTQIAFFSRMPAGGDAYQARLRAARVAVIGDGRLARGVSRQLRLSGVGEIVILTADPDAARLSPQDAADSPWCTQQARTLDRAALWSDDDLPPALIILAQEAEDPELLDAIDACSKRRDIPWLLVRAMESHVGWVGPLFIPEQTACYRSLEARLHGNLSFFGEHQTFERHLRETHTASAPCGGLHAFLDLIASAAVVESIKFICDLGVPHLAGRFITINLTNWDVESHDVLRVPRVGLEGAEPRLFAWKEMPHEDIAGHKEGIFARRS